MKQKQLMVIWHEKEQGVDRVWHLRSIQQNGHIFGEIRDNICQYAKTIEIDIRDDDSKKIFELAHRISEISTPPDESEIRSGWFGLLARGLLSEPQILMRYYPDDVKGESELFMEIIQTLSPYLIQFK